ncbi:MAG: SDR family NAD(P)-dependent oxidoreductase [Balneolaceae bacterium]|nr:SDR family NAD(P)-dependent oxidoreductase [Balneolaceae bacterium]
MNSDFDNRHIVVTGGAGSLGTAVVQALLDSGARCSVPCYDKREASSFDLIDRDEVFTLSPVDLTDEKQSSSFFNSAVEEQGDLWASVHIAGGFGMGAIEDTPLSDFERQWRMNTVTCYNACRTAVALMRSSSHKGGRIVNIASRPALEPRQGKGMTAYTVAKAGVAALTESLAAEVVKDEILVNALAPSIIDTPANRKAMPDADYDQWPKPEQLAQQIRYLVSPRNTVTRGAVIPVYGKS